MAPYTPLYYKQYTTVETPLTRTAWLTPFDQYSAQNLPLGTGATYESASDTRTAKLLTGNPEASLLSWTTAVGRATMASPEVLVRASGSGAGDYIIRCPSNLQAAGGTDGHVVVVQPDGVTACEIYAFTRTGVFESGREVITTSYYNVNDLLGNGLRRGSQASGISLLHGQIRAHELANLNIPHCIRLAIPASMLKDVPDSSDGTLSGTFGSSLYQRQVWPARLSDNRANHNYIGPIAMGSAFGIPPSVNLNTLGLTPEGLALGKCLQTYPALVLLQAETVGLSVEPTANAQAFARLRTDWMTKLFQQMRRITNYANGLTLDANNTPSDWSMVGGGGTRRAALSGPVTA